MRRSRLLLFILLITPLVPASDAATILRLGSASGVPGGRDYAIPVYLINQTEIAGLQFTIRDVQKVIGIDSIRTTVRTQNFTSILHENSAIFFDLNGNNIAAGDDPIMELRVRIGTEAKMGQDTLRLAGKTIVASDKGEMIADIVLESGFIEIVAEDDEKIQIPGRYKLWQNYPNPFNLSTKIEFGLAGDGRVKLILFDLNGRHIATVMDKNMSSGRHEVVISARGLASGIYLYQLQAAGFTNTRKMIIIK